MPKVQYKQKKGALHIGGGRFFYAAEPVEVTAEEVGQLLGTFEDLEEVEEEQDHSYTSTNLKKLNAEQQKEVITSLGGNPDETKNEEERISLILELQELEG